MSNSLMLSGKNWARYGPGRNKAKYLRTEISGYPLLTGTKIIDKTLFGPDQGT